MCHILIYQESESGVQVNFAEWSQNLPNLVLDLKTKKLAGEARSEELKNSKKQK